MTFDKTKPIEGLDETLKIPLVNMTSEMITNLKSRRQYIADLFFDKTKPASERNAVFDEGNKLNQFFGHKLFQYRIKEKGSGSGYKAPGPAVIEEPKPEDRAANLKLFWETALPLVDARVKAIVRDPPENNGLDYSRRDLHLESERKYYEELALIVWLGGFKNERK